MNTCARCGQQHDPARCTGHVKLDGGGLRPCGCRPIKGATVCRVHGGAARQVKAAAKERIAMEKARAAVAALGLSRDVSPHEALTEAIHRTAGDVSYLGTVVEELHGDRLLFTDDGPGNGTMTRLHPAVQLYREAVRDLATISRGALAAGVEERRHQLDVAMAGMLVQVIKGVLGGLSLTAEQQALVPGVVRAQLAVITGGQVAA